MHAFAELVIILGTTTKTNAKLEALQNYFATAPGKDKVWVIAIFSGRKPKRIINSTLLSQWCLELTSLPAWLFEESYHTVGDLAETIALLLPEKNNDTIQQQTSLSYYLEKFIELEKAGEQEKKNSSWIAGINLASQNALFLINSLPVDSVLV